MRLGGDILASYSFAKDAMLSPGNLARGAESDFSKKLILPTVINGVVFGAIAAFKTPRFSLWTVIFMVPASVILFLISLVMAINFGGRIIHFLGRIVGVFGESSDPTLNAVICSVAPFATLSWLVVLWTPLSAVLSLWSFFILVYALSAFHGISKKRALVALSIPIAISVAYFLVDVYVGLYVSSMLGKSLFPV